MLNRLQQIRPALSSSESRVADWILANPHKAISTTLADVARWAEVSEPTVLRFCRSAGSTGFRDFKTRLAQSLASTDHVVHADVSLDDDTAQIAAKVIGRSVQELMGVQQRINAISVDQALDAMSQAKRLEFYGIGASGYVVHDAQNKFFRLGLPCVAYSDSSTISQAAAILSAEHVIVLVSKSGRTPVIVDAAREAKERGAYVIAITSVQSDLANAADISLFVDVNEDTSSFTPMSSRLAQLTVLDVLQVGLALRLGDNSHRNLDRTKRALTRLGSVD